MTLGLSMGRRVRVAVRQAHRPEEDRGEDSRAAREKSTSGGVLGQYVGATPFGAEMISAPLERNYSIRLLGQAGGRWAFFNGLI